MSEKMMPEEVKEAADKLGGEWIKASEFTGNGLVLQIAKSMEKVSSKYGALETDYLVKNEILEKGQTFRYSFNTSEGAERKIDSKSTPLFIGFKQVEELGVGDWVKVIRTGEREETRFTVEKVDAPLDAKPVSLRNKPDYPENSDEMAENIPF